MRISTLQTFDRNLNSITSNQNLLTKAQERVLAGGRRIINASDDPVRAIQGQNIRLELGRLEQFNFNAKGAKELLSKQEVRVNSAIEALQEIQTAMLEVKNGTYDIANRESIAKKVDEKLRELASITNAKDENGNFIFAGFKGQVQPFSLDAQGQYAYNGDQGQSIITIADGVSVVKKDSGYKVFGSVKGGNGTFETKANQTNQGTGIISKGSVSDPSQVIDVTYTITFVGLNSSGKFAYRVDDSNGNQVIPQPPAHPVDDAPEFNEGGKITVNGMTVTISGTPAQNDTFTIKPADTQNMLNIAQGAAQALRLPAENDVERAYFNNENNAALRNVEQALEKLRAIQSDTGARINALDSIVNNNKAFSADLTNQLNTVEDIDYVEAISDMVFQASMLQAAQQSFVKIQQLSIFNYI